MNLAFIISAYKVPEQLVRLVRRLNSDHASFFIHIDRKSSDTVAREGLRDLANVHFLDRHICHWGDFGHVRASLKGIHEMVTRGVKFDYAILLTGQDYPIKSNREIERTLEAGQGKSFLNPSPMPYDRWEGGGMDRIEQWHFHLGDRHMKLPLKRSFPDGLKPFCGLSYWCLSRECVEYIEKFAGQRPDVVCFFEHVRIPDEIFFHTVVMNSPFKDKLVKDTLRYFEWQGQPNPKVLTKDDFEKFIHAPKLFARKFDITLDASVLDMIDAHINHG